MSVEVAKTVEMETGREVICFKSPYHFFKL